MAAPFDPSQHPRSYHGEFSPTGTRNRSLGRSLQSVNQDHPPGGWGHVLSMAYGGVMGAAGNVSATISYDQPPTVPSEIVHVAGWVGVSGGEHHWLQVGIAFLPSGEARLYAESRDAKGRYDFRDLGAATPHTAYRMAVVKAGKVWVAMVNGRRVGAVRVPGVDTSGVSAEVASSTYQPTGATYRLHFRDVKAPGGGKPQGKPGATVTTARGGFDAYSSPPVSKSDTRSLVAVRYPVLVRKQDTTAAGIAVRAADTGRVLMLQRSIADETDPARGKWEFPGGKLDGDEDPFQGAAREWQEETGVPLPAGAHTGSWQSGPYVGHVYVVPHESDVPLNLDGNDRPIGNPDDPDGDDCETLAWWPPSDAEGMPGLRDEVAAGTDWKKIKQAVPGAVFKTIRPRMRATIRKRAYPVLVRSHVRGGQLDEQVKAELARYLDANPALRAAEAADHGFDPAADPAKYLAAERAEGYHDSLKGSGPVDMTKLLAWEREESSEYANGVRKDQPSVSDVHVDAPLGEVSVANTGNSKRRKRKPEVIDDLAVKVIKADAAKQLVYGIVLEPHRVDSQGDWEDHGDIEDACHRYLGQVFKEGVTDLVNLQHRWQAPAGVYPVENYIAPADFELNGEPVAKGSWVLVVKVGDPAVWQQVLDGEWGGLSVEGTGVRDYDRPAPVAKAEPDIEKALGARLIGWLTGADQVVKEQPAPVINVHVPAQEPPVVNVHNEIPAPVAKDSDPPVIHVHVPEQPAPTVHVEPAAVTVEAPEVHVHQEHIAPRPVRVEERRGVKRYIPE